MNQDNQESRTPLTEIVELRKAKIQELRKRGIEPYPARSRLAASALSTAEFRQRFANLEAEVSQDTTCSLSGRLIARREMGRACFGHILDGEGKAQIYLRANTLGNDAYRNFLKDTEIGDFLALGGTPFRTRTGELTLEVKDWELLAKSLRPLPEKWHGLRDPELRYRQRYLDLVVNPEVREVFYRRSRLIQIVRNFLDRQGFLEVETPVIQPEAGGAIARPFTTHHNTLDEDFYLRIAPELYLKRLLVGGFPKIYELGRCFRNEGIDRYHNPEFTMLEVYQAGSDYYGMRDLCAALLTALTEDLLKDGLVQIEDKAISLKFPLPEVRLPELFREYTGQDLLTVLESGDLGRLAHSLGIELEPGTPENKIFDRIFDEKILPHLAKEAVFVFDYPRIFSPLAKAKPEEARLVERFELFIGGREVANAYSELNDPEEQRKRFLEQLSQRHSQGEMVKADEDFLTALEYGMPPAGGLGIGIDRLALLFSGSSSLREVILFPLLRRLK